MQKGNIELRNMSVISISPLFLILSNPKMPILATVWVTVVLLVIMMISFSFDYFDKIKFTSKKVNWQDKPVYHNLCA